MTSTLARPETALCTMTDDPAAHARSAVAVASYDVSGRMDIRSLWSRDGMHYFRVNFWKRRTNGLEQFVWRSVFVAVEETRSGLQVREMTFNRAA